VLLAIDVQAVVPPCHTLACCCRPLGCWQLRLSAGTLLAGEARVDGVRRAPEGLGLDPQHCGALLAVGQHHLVGARLPPRRSAAADALTKLAHPQHRDRLAEQLAEELVQKPPRRAWLAGRERLGRPEHHRALALLELLLVGELLLPAVQDAHLLLELLADSRLPLQLRHLGRERGDALRGREPRGVAGLLLLLQPGDGRAQCGQLLPQADDLLLQRAAVRWRPLLRAGLAGRS
jgi:hypothetical protein